MFSREKLAKSCGTAVAYGYMPARVEKIAASRWEDLKRSGCAAMLTASPQAYLCLKACVPEDKALVDLYGALA